MKNDRSLPGMRIGRRQFVKSLAAASVALTSGLAEDRPAPAPPQKKTGPSFDVAVIGAGVFGAWTAYQLRSAGRKVILLDEYGPGNSRSSSGGESRIIRMGYGTKELYTRWSMRSLELWQGFSLRVGQPFFVRTGVLWIGEDGDRNIAGSVATFDKLGVRYERLTRADLEKRFPQIALGPKMIGLYEPDSGALLARRAVQAVVAEAARAGAEYRARAVASPAGSGRLEAITTGPGESVSAGSFVFACGPWLPKIFPELLRERIVPTRGEEFFFGPAAGDSRFGPPAMPTWIDHTTDTFGCPDLESRGFKVGTDLHGSVLFDPDRDKRELPEDALRFAREFLARRFPALKDAPLLEVRVCQYENTANEDFLIDRHPGFDNVWLVGGGSGHGFKHGPALGEYVAKKVIEGGEVEPIFALASKTKVKLGPSS